MIRVRKLAVTALGASLAALVGSAGAAQSTGEIKQINGSVLISQGERYVAAREGMNVRAFDRLIVLEDAKALLEFQDGCRYQVQEPGLLTLSAISLCTGKARQHDPKKTAAPSDLASVERVSQSLSKKRPGVYGAQSGTTGAATTGGAATAGTAAAGTAAAGTAAAGTAAAAAGTAAAALSAVSLGGGLLVGLGGLVVLGGIASSSGGDVTFSSPPISPVPLSPQ